MESHPVFKDHTHRQGELGQQSWCCCFSRQTPITVEGEGGLESALLPLPCNLRYSLGTQVFTKLFFSLSRTQSLTLYRSVLYFECLSSESLIPAPPPTPIRLDAAFLPGLLNRTLFSSNICPGYWRNLAPSPSVVLFFGLFDNNCYTKLSSCSHCFITEVVSSLRG